MPVLCEMCSALDETMYPSLRVLVMQCIVSLRVPVYCASGLAIFVKISAGRHCGLNYDSFLYLSLGEGDLERRRMCMKILEEKVIDFG
jgi:hypothetical protein